MNKKELKVGTIGDADTQPFILPSSQTIAKNNVSCRLLLRIAADLQKEYVRQTDDMVKADLETQIEGLKALYKEVEDYRTIRRLLNGS